MSPRRRSVVKTSCLPVLLSTAITVVVARAGAQNPAPPAAPPHGEGQAAAPPGGPAGRGGRGQGRGAVFPAQQRPPADPALVERGKGLFSINCSACHGVDARGGQLGGPNLLRSQVVLDDRDGELIAPIVHGARASKGMPPLNLNDEDVKAVAAFLHELQASGGRQGAPPPAEGPPVNIVVGDAAAGQAYFARKCAACHSATGDLQGIAARIPDAKTLQNLWVSGGAGGGRGGRGSGASASRASAVTAVVAMPSGEKIEGRLLHIDDFLVTLVQSDGTVRSVRREGAVPAVEVHDPLQAHRDLLADLTEKDMHDVTAYLVTLK